MIGNKVIHFETIDSTNNFIKRNVDTLQDGTIVLSDEQTDGRGRFGNKWISPKGNLYFSFLLKKKAQRSVIFPLIMKTSVAILNTLEHFGISANIKFPNDIVISDHKIAGILIESIGYDEINAVVVGVGINVEQRLFQEFNYQATSFALETVQSPGINEILDMFLTIYNKLCNEEIIYDIYKNNLTFFNKFALFEGKSCKIIDIDINGKIKLETEKTPVYLSYQDAIFS